MASCRYLLNSVTEIEYQVIRTKRKTLALCVDSKAMLTVRAPLRMSSRDIDAFVKKKKQWILKKQHQAVELDVQYQPLELVTGETLSYLGEDYSLLRKDVEAIQLSGSSLLVPDIATKEDLVTWLKHKAKDVFQERTEYYAKIMGVSYNAVKLSGAKTRWGSCSAKNNLNFTWRLVLCPPCVIDYIVVHELCHIIHMNHSREFWAEVKSILPDYKEQQYWLKRNRKILDVL